MNFSTWDMKKLVVFWSETSDSQQQLHISPSQKLSTGHLSLLLIEGLQAFLSYLSEILSDTVTLAFCIPWNQPHVDDAKVSHQLEQSLAHLDMAVVAFESLDAWLWWNESWRNNLQGAWCQQGALEALSSRESFLNEFTLLHLWTEEGSWWFLKCPQGLFLIVLVQNSWLPFNGINVLTDLTVLDHNFKHIPFLTKLKALQIFLFCFFAPNSHYKLG
jgi:hypothetical protein